MTASPQANATANPNRRVWLIVGIAALILVCICGAILFVLFALPALLGPAIGNVFSDVILTVTAGP